MSGLSCIESFFFSMHALGSYYSEKDFKLTNKALQKVTPNSVTEKFENLWPCFNLTSIMRGFIVSSKFKRWKNIRNIITHRVVPPRLISVKVGDSVTVTWQIQAVGGQEENEIINESTTTQERAWLADQLKIMVAGLCNFYPT